MVDSFSTKNSVLVLLYIAAAVISYFIFTSSSVILYKIVIVVLMFFALVLLTIPPGFFKQETPLPSESSDMLRYTMACRSCGWEWMSNVTKKALAPTKCPNCSDDKLEILGWRKVKVLNKQNKDLREFVK